MAEPVSPPPADDPEERGRRNDEAIQLAQDTGITDDRCHARCTRLRDWFAHETRGLIHHEESHELLDMVLNRLADDGLLKETSDRAR